MFYFTFASIQRFSIQNEPKDAAISGTFPECMEKQICTHFLDFKGNSFSSMFYKWSESSI